MTLKELLMMESILTRLLLLNIYSGGEFGCRKSILNIYLYIFFFSASFQAMCRDSRIIPGGAATEIELAKRLREFSFKETG
jgi:hypothetical protein